MGNNHNIDTIAGYYCEMPHSLQETGECSAGYFCQLGSNTPTPNGINNTGIAGKWCRRGRNTISHLFSAIFCCCEKGTHNSVTNEYETQKLGIHIYPYLVQRVNEWEHLNYSHWFPKEYTE